MKRLSCRNLVVCALAVSGMVELTSPLLVAQAARSPTIGLRRVPLSQNVWPADFNGDGVIDLAGSEPPLYRGGGGRVVALIGDGSGDFAPPLATAFIGHVLGVGDFNGDGRSDLIVVDETNANVAILPGNGDATFGAPRMVAATADVTFALSADIDGDGRRDLVVGAEGFTVALYPGNGDFTFNPPVTLAVNASPHGAVVSDFNGDGMKDLAIANHYSHSVTVLLNQRAWQFAGADVTIGGNGNDVTVADVNRDGHEDLIVATTDGGDGDSWFADGHAEVWLGRGDGTFAAGPTYAVARGAWQVVVGDFTRDGIVDIATANRSSIVFDDCASWRKTWDSVSILPGQIDGTFGPASSFSLGRQDDPDDSDFTNQVLTLSAADVNGDGAADLIASWGAVLLNVEADANWAPVVDAGPDQDLGGRHEALLQARAVDDDQDMLTWIWRNDAGTIVASWPNVCLGGLHDGINTFTVTVDDGHGHQATDTMTVLAGDSTGGSEYVWQHQDVGAVGRSGSTSYDAGVFTVTGSGADIWGTADELHYAYLNDGTDEDSGALIVTAHVDSVQNVHQWTKAGVMIRASLAPASPHASVFVSPGKGVVFQRRLAQGGLSVSTAGPAITAPVWVRIVLGGFGETLRGYYKKDANDPWTLIGEDRAATSWHRPYSGLAVSSHVDGVPATARFSRVSAASPREWVATRIGASSGSAAFEQDSATINGTGADIWNASDQFEYLSDTCIGDCTITARVVSVDNTHAWAKAGVMIRETLDASSSHVDAIVSSSKGLAMQYRATTGGVSMQAATASGAAPRWVRLTRTGSLFTSYRSVDGVTFTEIGRVTVPMQSAVRIGLAVTSHNASAVATAAFDNILVEQP